MVSFMVILFSTKCFMFLYMYLDLLRLKAYKLFENSAADQSAGWGIKAPLVTALVSLVMIEIIICKI